MEFPPLSIGKYATKVHLPYQNSYLQGKVFDISDYIKQNSYTKTANTRLFKCAFPSWDNTARKAMSNCTIFKFNCALYKIWLKNLITWTQKNHPKNERFVFINAWNEWAEGAHLEPDTHFGYAYLQATKEALEENL